MSEKVASLVRIVRFSATHHYSREDWSEERNREAFGDQIAAHSHEYRVEVTIGGPVDPITGFIVDLTALDELLQREIMGPLDGSDLNESVPSVAEGEAQPSTEMLALHFWERLAPEMPGAARLERLRVFESDELGAEVRSPTPPRADSNPPPTVS